MIRVYLLPLLAIAGISLAAWTVHRGGKAIPAAQPVVAPAVAPFPAFVAGSGMVEASSENIAIAAPIAGIAVEVPAVVGAEVAAGAALFRLDDRAARAQLATAEADAAVRRAAVERLAAWPRTEDRAAAEAQVAAAQAEAGLAQDLLTRAQKLAADGVAAISTEEVMRRGRQLEAARARAAEVEARLAALRAGSWQPDVAQARAELAAAEARAASIRVDLERLTVTAPIAATVLKVDVRAGEFVPAANAASPPILLGVVKPLHLRVDIDENDAWRVRPGARAVANPRGNPSRRIDLAFVRIEPYVVPKRSLTGESTERVDTRVMQAIYRVEPADGGLLVGQLVDVFIDAPPIDAPAP